MTRIAVDQSPSGGSNYPLRFEHDLSVVLLDVFLSYDDELCEFVYPFRIAWLSGFATTSVGTREVQIVDAEGSVVFDSAGADYQENAWGADRLVAEWYVGTSVLRMVWLNNDQNLLADFYLPDEDAVLDPRTYARNPDRVRTILVNEQLLTGDVELLPGYNVALSVDERESVDGGEFTERIQLDGVVGAGDGRVPGCEEVEAQLRRLNGVGPDAAGNFIIETAGCVRQQLLLRRRGSTYDFTARYYEPEMSTEEAMAALKLDDDCSPCCPCDAYVFTYRGITRVWDKWATVAAALEDVRDLYSENVDRWNTQRDCRIAEPFKITAKSQPGGVTFVGANFCNLSHCCLAPVEIRFTVVRYSEGGTLGSAPNIVIKEAYVSGTGIDGESKYAPQLVDNVIVFRFDGSDPQKTTSIRLRFCYDSVANDSLSIVGTVHYPDPPANSFGEVCVMPEPSTPSILTSNWGPALSDVTLRAVAYRAAPVNVVPPSYPCTSCDCS